MSNNKKNTVLLCNGISSGRNRTQFQRIKALCENYNLYIFSQMKVCEEIETKAAHVKYCPLKKFHLDELVFPFWAYWQTRKVKGQKSIGFVYTTYHNLEIFTGQLCSKLGIKWIADIWDHPALSIEVSRGGKSMIKKLKYWHGRFFFRQTEKHLKKADMYVIALAEGAMDEFDLPKEKIFYVTNGIDLGIDYGEDLSNTDQFRLIYVGAVKKIRGVNFIIKAASFLKEKIPGMRITLVGPGDQEDREYLEGEIKKNQLSDIIEWKGELPHSETLLEIQKSNVCLYPFPKNKELDFIYPIKIFEYMAMGKIIVANNSTGIKAIMKENEDAVLFDPEKDNDLGEKILQIYKDPALQGKLRQNAALNVEKYDWSIISKSIINKINNFLGTYEN